MSFRSVVAAPKRKSGPRGFGCTVGKHGFMISCPARSIDEAGLKLGERYGLLLGEGEDAGRARIVRADQRGGRMLSRMGQGGGRIQFGNIPDFGDSIRACERIVWKRIDKDTLEITLPEDWTKRAASADTSTHPGEMLIGGEWKKIPPEAKQSFTPPKPPAPSAATKPKASPSSRAQFVKGLAIEFKFDEESITFRDKIMDVTASEAALALRLAKGAPSPVARSFLIQHVYAGHRNDDANVLLDRDARGLAKALEAIGLKLNTVKGVGFSIGGLV